MSATPHLRETLPAKLLGEFLGTALLLIIVVGSGIQAQQLTNDVGIQLLANSTATGFGLTVLILIFGPVSGAHFNPVVTIADAIFGRVSIPRVVGYIAAQVAGGVFGVVLANLMFGMAAVSVSTKDRASGGHWLSEVIATVGLLLTIVALLRSQQDRWIAPAVGSYIAGAYWFTSSTSFANPAVTVARIFSNSFAGIAPGSVPGFVIAQFVGLVVALGLFAVLYSRRSTPPIDDPAGSSAAPTAMQPPPHVMDVTVPSEVR